MSSPLSVSWNPVASCFVVTDAYHIFVSFVKTDADLCLMIREYSMNPQAVTDREANCEPWRPVEEHPRETTPSERLAFKSAAGKPLSLDDLFDDDGGGDGEG